MSNLNDYRARKAAAIAYHPAVWSPQDSIDTAQAFAAELANAERGVPDKPRWTAKLFGRSRFRRAKVYDGIAVALLLAVMAVLGCAVVLAAPYAHAEPDTLDPAAVAFAAHNAAAVCATLGGDPSASGVLGVVHAIEAAGLTADQTSQVVVLSVDEMCPRYEYVLQQFIDRYGSTPVVVA